MTSKQYNLMRYINTHDVHTEHCKQFNQITLYSLSRHEWIERRGTHILVTNEGANTLERVGVYNRSMGTYGTDMTERVQLALKLMNIREMKKVG